MLSFFMYFWHCGEGSKYQRMAFPISPSQTGVCVCAKEAQPSLRKGPMNHKALVNLSSFTIFSSVVSFLSSSRHQMSDGALK